MAGITSFYNQVPRIRNVRTNKIILPIGGSNPADLGPVILPNVRGQVSYIIISGDNSFTSSFSVTGGFGDFPDDWTQDWYFNVSSNVNCTVRTLQKNRLEVTTPAADAGGRQYNFEFKPVQSIGPTIRQNSVNTIGNFSLTVRIQKQNIVEGF